MRPHSLIRLEGVVEGDEGVTTTGRCGTVQTCRVTVGGGPVLRWVGAESTDVDSGHRGTMGLPVRRREGEEVKTTFLQYIHLSTSDIGKH